MVEKIKLIIASVLLGSGMALAFAGPVAAQGGAAGQAQQDVCAGIQVTGGTCADNGTGIANVIKVIVQIISVIAGVAAVIMIIFGGLKYITSGGDSSKVSSAKSTIMYAIIGLVVVALAQLIVRFVTKEATSTR